MPTRRWTVVVVAAVVVAVVIGWYWWPTTDGPQLVAGPISVSYDASTARLTAIVNVRNTGDRPMIASISNDVFVDSQKQRLNDPRQQPWRAELGSKQSNPVTFILQGDSAAAVWSGVRLMEVTIGAVYEGNAKLTCHFNFMGRFYPELKQIGIVSNATSPRQCERR